MLVLLMIILAVSLIIGIKCIKDEDKRFDACFLWCVAAIIWAIAFFADCGIVVDGYTIADKIAVYEEENAEIDTQICEIIKGYKAYEGEVFNGIKNKSADVLIELYPELKLNELISKQMDIYTTNKYKILSLREDLTSQKAARWWLYFGS